jgi:hypothetical protein
MAANRLAICTGWSPKGYGLYGQKFLDGFLRFWPREVALYVGVEDVLGPPIQDAQRVRTFHDANVHFFQLSQMPMWTGFEERHRLSARAGGREPSPQWKDRDRAAGYAWKFDAFKWARQAFIPWYVNVQLGEGGTPEFLVWLDGDVITHSPVALEGILGLIGTKEFAFLGRGTKHPDIAFQMYRRGGYCADFLGAWVDLYASDKVFDLPEWHSAWTWKYILDRDGYADLALDLTPGGHGHVWHQSPLRTWGDHLKGDRKYAGRSPERR